MISVFGGTLNLTHLNCSLQEQLVQMSTTHSRFDQHCMHYLLYFSHCCLLYTSDAADE